MGFVRILITSFVILALVASGVIAAGFESSGIGVTARGMAGAFRAVASDWTAAYYNPAGYAFLQDNELGFNASFLHYRLDLTPNYLFDGIYESGVFNHQANVNEHKVLSNPSGGFAVRIPFQGEAILGFSAYSYFDDNLTWRMYELPYAYNHTLTLPGDQYSINLDVVAFQATLAKSFSEDKLSFGFGLQLLRADLVYSDIIFRDNPYDAPLGIRPWDKITEWNKNDGNGWGFGLTAGLLYNVTEDLKLGLNARIPFDITIKGNSSLEYFMPSIPTIDGSLDSAGVENPGSFGTAGNLFVAGNQIVDSADFETKLKLPSSFGLGLAYQVTEDLLVSLDAEYTLWSKFDGLNFAFSNHRGLTGAADTSELANAFFTADASNPVEWDNTGKVMLGLKYDLKDMFTVLAGTGMDQSPMRNSIQQSPQFFDTGDKFTLSGGLIWHYREWDFGVASSYTSYPDLTSSALVDLDGDGLTDNINGLYEGSLYETVFSFIYRF